MHTQLLILLLLVVVVTAAAGRRPLAIDIWPSNVAI